MISDRSPRPMPPMALPAAGGVYVDPQFGGVISRVTDETMGEHNVHAYSYWPVWNASYTRMLLACDGVPWLFFFDPSTGASRRDRPLRSVGDVRLQWQGACWDPLLPDVLYALDDQVKLDSGARLWRVDVNVPGTPGYSVLKDFRALRPGEAARQLSMSADAQVFSFHFQSTNKSPDGTKKTSIAVVWNRTTNDVFTTSVTAPGRTLNETQLSRFGSICHLALNQFAGTEQGSQLWACQSGSPPHLANDWYKYGSPDYITGHVAMGARSLVLASGLHSGIDVREYTALRHPRTVLVFHRSSEKHENYDVNHHVSLPADERQVLCSTYGRYVVANEPFQDELILVATDGSGFQRLAHTRSTNGMTDYWSQPRAHISGNGRWACWTSDLGTKTRHDVFSMALPHCRKDGP